MKLLIVFFLISLFTCCNSSTKKLNGNNSEVSKDKDSIVDTLVSSSDLLIYYEEIAGSFNCMKKSLPDGEPSLIANFSIQPLDAIWDSQKGIVYFITSKGVFKKSYLIADQFVKISEALPKIEEAYNLGEAWIDANTNSIRISYEIFENDFDERLRNKMDDYVADTNNYLIDFGIPMFACISELSKNGKWITVKEVASTGAACDTPGLEVLNDLIKRKTKTTSTGYSIQVSNCYGAIILLKEDEIVNLDSIGLHKYFGSKKQPDVEGFYLRKINKKFDLVISALWFTKPCYAFPVFLYDKEKKKLKELTEVKSKFWKDENSTSCVFNSTNYVFIAKDYYNLAPIIYDAKTFLKVAEIPKAFNAFILEK